MPGSRLRALRLVSEGTLLRADCAQWLAEHGVHLAVGLDGLVTAHDANRHDRQGGRLLEAVDAAIQLHCGYGHMVE